MRLTILDDKLWFPPVENALPDGLLAAGGDLSADKLLLAYRNGIFPWYNEDEPPLWWCPDPRFVLYPAGLRVSKSMRQVLRSGTFEFRMNTGFAQVIRHCMQVPRPGQDGTWISPDVAHAYTQLHRLGHAHCAEAWQDGQLVGGLYGVWLGKVFFGESMFSRVSNASKFAFINWVQHLQQHGVQLIDCQVHTAHLQSLGARMIPRKEFVEMVRQWV
ncbi:leucyl/phenylalanyl-tRNA--protein transferase [Nemorincola caseinilytica]|uniref:Leucyl/phenylalanyl-tRNA--protein transferase n=1 Tax=Nemorincola caseinilytica TaxID=2054315 RepID=A0ABP8N7U3_9BACT